MAAQEQQRERVVIVRWQLLTRQLQDRIGLLTSPPGALAAPLVNQASRGDGQQPRSRVRRNTLSCPLQRRGQERLLDGILTGVELAVPPHERTENLGRELAQQVLNPRLNRHI